MELAGLGLLVLFGWLVWPPLAALVAGVVLVLAANGRARRRRRQHPTNADGSPRTDVAQQDRPRVVVVAEQLLRAVAAYRSGPPR
jgi:hypothetical protein